MSNNNISFILHKPQLSENIGACARAMKNFDFQKMIVVDPKPIFPNDKILATSVGAKDVIDKSKTFNDLKSALKNIDIVFADRRGVVGASAGQDIQQSLLWAFDCR